MITIHIEHYHEAETGNEVLSTLSCLKSELAEIRTVLAHQNEALSTHTQLLKEIQMTDAELTDLLTKVDLTTTAIGTNVQAIADVQTAESATVQTISDEIDALVADKANNISAANAAKLTDLANRLQTSADNSKAAADAAAAQVPVLIGIATKGGPTIPDAPPAPVLTPAPDPTA